MNIENNRELPLLVGNTSAENIDIALKLKYLKDEGLPILRGDQVPEIPSISNISVILVRIHDTSKLELENT